MNLLLFFSNGVDEPILLIFEDLPQEAYDTLLEYQGYNEFNQEIIDKVQEIVNREDVRQLSAEDPGYVEGTYKYLPIVLMRK